MKQAVGEYAQVRAVNLQTVIALSGELFGDEVDKLWDEADKLRDEVDKLKDEADKLGDEADKLGAEACKLWDEADKLGAEVDKLWTELAIKYGGYIPDYRAMNFVAADRDGVYCFVWPRKEIWLYDGETCPDPDTVEVVWRGGD